MTFTARAYTDLCPTIGTCPQCGLGICDECGGSSAPVTCGDDTHCAACETQCPDCMERAA